MAADIARRKGGSTEAEDLKHFIQKVCIGKVVAARHSNSVAPGTTSSCVARFLKGAAQGLTVLAVFGCATPHPAAVLQLLCLCVVQQPTLCSF
jgi:hypothetical protein